MPKRRGPKLNLNPKQSFKKLTNGLALTAAVSTFYGVPILGVVGAIEGGVDGVKTFAVNLDEDKDADRLPSSFERYLRVATEMMIINEYYNAYYQPLMDLHSEADARSNVNSLRMRLLSYRDNSTSPTLSDHDEISIGGGILGWKALTLPFTRTVYSISEQSNEMLETGVFDNVLVHNTIYANLNKALDGAQKAYEEGRYDQWMAERVREARALHDSFNNSPIMPNDFTAALREARKQIERLEGQFEEELSVLEGNVEIGSETILSPYAQTVANDQNDSNAAPSEFVGPSIFGPRAVGPNFVGPPVIELSEEETAPVVTSANSAPKP